MIRVSMPLLTFAVIIIVAYTLGVGTMWWRRRRGGQER